MIDADKKLVDAIIAAYEPALKAGKTNKSFNEWVSENLLAVRDIKRKLSQTDWQESELTKKLKEELTKVKSTRRDVQNTCPHLSTTYHGDPSGGSDSQTVCDICGKDMGR